VSAAESPCLAFTAGFYRRRDRAASQSDHVRVSPRCCPVYQQLAKLLYTPGRSGPAVVTERAALAVKLDLGYSRQQILQMYAAVVYFGHGFYGLAAASCGYFSVRPAALS
jgi:membrane carboxypeptidase/penicillin-binding protein